MNSRTLDNNSQASTQCLLPITRAEYARYRGRNVAHRSLLHLTSFIPMGLRKIAFLQGGFRWVHFREHFKFGCINPAVVLDVKTRLVASYTDLNATHGQKPFLVIKIFRERLELLALPALPGDRFAAVALYRRAAHSKETGRWDDFYPIVIDCVINDIHKCEFAKARILDSEWKELEMGLAQIPPHDKNRPGTYKIDLPHGL